MTMARLRAAYADPEREVGRALAEGRRPIRTLGHDAPFERLAAAGFQPIRLAPPALATTPHADAIMGSAAMGARGRRLLEAMLAGRHPDVPVLITQADAEQPQLFAALRELGRLGEAVPKHVHFIDLLHIDRHSSRAYNAKRLEQLDVWLAGLKGTEATPPAALELFEKQDRALRQLDELRAEGKISGLDALRAIGAARILPIEEFISAIEAALAEFANGPQLAGRRVIISGTAHETDAIYEAIEQNGALIVGECHGWGHPAEPPARATAPRDYAQRVAVLARARGADAVIHLRVGDDEAGPWDFARAARALDGTIPVRSFRCGLEPSANFQAEIAAFLGGAASAPVLPGFAPRAPAPQAKDAGRSRKSLASVADFNAYQRQWFASVRQQVTDGAPFAVVNANAPQEILRALDIPFVVNQWWASIVAAKQQSRRYQGLLRAKDYPADVEAYSAQGLAALHDKDPDAAPWGGLPRPDFLHAIASSDPALKMFELWAEDAGAQAFIYERTVDPRPDLFTDWWKRLPKDWNEALEPERLDLLVDELRDVIASLEAATGRMLSWDRLRMIMDLVNEQEHYYRKTRDLIARTVPAPIGVVDQMPATMVPQWHRGTEWARDAAKAFYEEVKARADAGLGAVPSERIRLMWVGRGLWSEMGFYQKWEESHGAVFVWSMYLALAADGYIRELAPDSDLLRALASRFLTMGDELRMPTWAGPWHVHEARTHQVDAAVALQDADPFVVRALRAGGVPVLELTADNFNREGDDATAIEAAITAFIEGPARQRSEARRVST